MLVRRIDQPEDRRERVSEVELRGGHLVCGDRRRGGVRHRALRLPRAVGCGHEAAGVGLDHLHRAGHQVAQTVGEVGVEAGIELLRADR